MHRTEIGDCVVGDGSCVRGKVRKKGNFRTVVDVCYPRTVARMR